MTNFIKMLILDENARVCVAVASRSIHRFVLLSRSDEEATVLYLFQTFHVDSCFAPLAEGVTVLLCLNESNILPETSHKERLNVLRAKVRGHGNGRDSVSCSETLQQDAFSYP